MKNTEICPDCSLDGTLYNYTTGLWDLKCPRCKGSGKIPLKQKIKDDLLRAEIYNVVRTICSEDKLIKIATDNLMYLFERYKNESRENSV